MTITQLPVEEAWVAPLSGGSDLRGKGRMLVPEGPGVPDSLRQVSVLTNRLGTLRGFHVAEYPGHSKLISCLSGRVFDVLVDLRADSPTYREVATVELSGAEPSAVRCPAGVAHGFLSLTEGSLVTIGVDAGFRTVAERPFDALDPALGIDWPDVGVEPIRSDRDASAPPLRELLGHGFVFSSPA